jgi:hypothetical protein
MTVIVIGHISVDTANVERLWAERPGDFAAVSEESKKMGCTSHQWGFADDGVVLVDHWPDAGTFQAFFEGNQAIPELMQATGVTKPPEFEIVELKTGPDSF